MNNAGLILPSSDLQKTALNCVLEYLDISPERFCIKHEFIGVTVRAWLREPKRSMHYTTQCKIIRALEHEGVSFCENGFTFLNRHHPETPEGSRISAGSLLRDKPTGRHTTEGVIP